LYQTLVGMWPIEPLNESGWAEFVGRIDKYMLKAAREAKEHTSWANANQDYENALSEFIRGILDRGRRNPFLPDFAKFHHRIARVGAFNSLSQCLLKLTSPGVPDIYQANELFTFSLVDPDNRRPVDYEKRREILEQLRAVQSPERLIDSVCGLPEGMNASAAKLYLTWKSLTCRNSQSKLFQQGSYIPLKVTGQRSEHVVAFAREHEGRTAVVAVPRLCATLLGDDLDTVCDEKLWADTCLELALFEADCFHNIFTGECIPLSESERRLPIAGLLRHFPVALLLSEAPGSHDFASDRLRTCNASFESNYGPP